MTKLTNENQEGENTQSRANVGDLFLKPYMSRFQSNLTVNDSANVDLLRLPQSMDEVISPHPLILVADFTQMTTLCNPTLG